MTSHQASRHPLDADLLDFVEGTCDDVVGDAIAAHLTECVVCRIKRQRLTGAPPMDIVDVRQLTIPPFGRIELEHASGAEAQRGELWLTSGDDATMVLVRSIRADKSSVVVVPVTLDIEVADHGSIILQTQASPLAVPIVIYEDLIVSLPATALVEHVVPARLGADLLELRVGDVGVSRGSALEGPADPRLEVRQYLVDRLVTLDPYQPARDSDESISFDRTAQVVALREELQFRRGPECDIQELTTLPVLAETSAEWIGIARVTDFAVRIIVIETPTGLIDDRDFSSAQALITRLDCSALAVRTPMNDAVDLYDAPTLFRAFELPEGTRASAPLISGLSLPDAVAKYLDQKRVQPFVSQTSHRAPRVDAKEVLAGEVAKAVDSTVKRASRLGPEKREGYKRLQSAREKLARVLVAALEPEFDPQSVVNVIEDERR